jgi:hypothetical protein
LKLCCKQPYLNYVPPDTIWVLDSASGDPWGAVSAIAALGAVILALVTIRQHGSNQEQGLHVDRVMALSSYYQTLFADPGRTAMHTFVAEAHQLLAHHVLAIGQSLSAPGGSPFVEEQIRNAINDYDRKLHTLKDTLLIGARACSKHVRIMPLLQPGLERLEDEIKVALESVPAAPDRYDFRVMVQAGAADILQTIMDCDPIVSGMHERRNDKK